MNVRLINMGFQYNNGRYVKVNTGIVVDITKDDNGKVLYKVTYGGECFDTTDLDSIEYMLLEMCGDDL